MKSVVNAIAVVAVAGLAACASVQPLKAPAAFIPERKPDRVWIASADGEVFQLLNPTIIRDSVVGTLMGTGERYAFPVADTEYQVFAKQHNKGRTATLVGSMALLGGLAAYGIAVGGNGEKGCATPGSRGCPVQ
jgi:hypothetical protein